VFIEHLRLHDLRFVALWFFSVWDFCTMSRNVSAPTCHGGVQPTSVAVGTQTRGNRAIVQTIRLEQDDLLRGAMGTSHFSSNLQSSSNRAILKGLLPMPEN
jgi:hypothetical protein